MSSPTFAQKLTAEAIGTAILVFIGAGSVPLTVFLTAGAGGTGSTGPPVCRRSRSRSPSRSSPRSTRSATSAAATSTRRSRSRCSLTRKIDGRTAGGYIVAQLVGAFIGAA